MTLTREVTLVMVGGGRMTLQAAEASKSANAMALTDFMLLMRWKRVGVGRRLQATSLYSSGDHSVDANPEQGTVRGEGGSTTDLPSYSGRTENRHRCSNVLSQQKEVGHSECGLLT